MRLILMRCDVCQADTPTLNSDAVAKYLYFVPEWRVVENKAIKRVFEFKNFEQARAFFNEVADIAEKENHHPDMCIHKWKNVVLSMTSHAPGGLTLNDFIVAAKVDSLHDLFFKK